MKKPVIIIRSHHIGFAFGFVVMLFAAQGVKHTFAPTIESQRVPIEQEVGQFVPLPEFKLAKHIDEKEKFWLSMENK